MRNILIFVFTFDILWVVGILVQTVWWKISDWFEEREWQAYLRRHEEMKRLNKEIYQTNKEIDNGNK